MKTMMKKEYISPGKIDLEKLRAAIDCRKGQFSLRALGAILDISHVALLKKLSGECPLGKVELQLLAARLGENAESFFFNSHSDAAPKNRFRSDSVSENSALRKNSASDSIGILVPILSGSPDSIGILADSALREFR